MKVAFVTPFFENLGIQYLSAVLKADGADTKLFIDPMLFDNFLIKKPLLSRMFSYGETLCQEIAAYKPDVVCFSVASDFHPWALDRAAKLRQYTSAPIVFGGPHPTAVPERVMARDVVDYVIVGEGEYALLDLVRALADKKDTHSIQNVWSRKQGQVISNPVRPLIQDLDSLPFPDKELFNAVYPGYVAPVYMTIASRGCAYQCVYCHNNYMREVNKGSRYFRWRSVDNVIAEIRQAKERYAIRKITFNDDMLVFNKEWFREFARKFPKEINLPYSCFAHPTLMDDEMIGLLESSGCRTLNIGLQTHSQEIRRNVLKRTETNAHIEHVFEKIRPTKIFLYANVMFGLPGQDRDELLNIVRFFKYNDVGLAPIFWLRPYPRTEILSYFPKEVVEDVNEGRIASPFSIGGVTFNKEAAQIASLLGICKILPGKVLDYIGRNRLYRFLPAINLSVPGLFINGIYSRIFTRKKYPFWHFGIRSLSGLYLFLFVRILKAKFRKGSA